MPTLKTSDDEGPSVVDRAGLNVVMGEILG
jgi:hypothetical protein